MDTRLQLNLHVQIQLQPQLQAVLIHHLAALVLLPTGLEPLLRVPGPRGDLASLGAGISDGSVHGGGVGPDALKGLHRVVLGSLRGGFFGDGGRTGFGVLLLRGIRGGGLLGFAAAGAAGLRARAVAWVGFGVGGGEGGGGHGWVFAGVGRE